jgi:tetratricopeptide (TPR) repeat protein
MSTHRLPLRHCRTIFAASCFASVFLTLAVLCSVWAQDSSPDVEEEVPAEQLIADRFLAILERNPRRSTSLDRAYDYYAATGDSETLITRYSEKIIDSPEDANLWLVLGLLHSERGDSGEAIAAFRQAETVDPTNALASYYLGEALVPTGLLMDAAEALERAVEREPVGRGDMLDALQLLGKVYGRLGEDEKASTVWDKLEEAFPNDQDVLEQLAETLRTEQCWDEALVRYERLIASEGNDPYARARWVMAAAAIKDDLGRKSEAISDYESLLDILDPDNWMYESVRDRIEETFLRQNDLAGLAQYYERRLASGSRDVDAMRRRARLLVRLGRNDEASEMLDSAIALAPSSADLRLARIDLLVAEDDFAKAAAAYEALDELDPNNPDYIQQWGMLLLLDEDQEESSRKAAAGAVWKRLIDAHPEDARTVVFVADLIAEAGLDDEALALYERAVELAPGDPTYHEYLGLFHHRAERPEEAVAAWSKMASGDSPRPDLLARLSEVLHGFGYTEESLAPALAAVEAEPTIFRYRLAYADMLLEGDQKEDALTQFNELANYAETKEEVETVLTRRISALNALERLEAEIELLKGVVEATPDDSERAVALWRLAMFLQAVNDAEGSMDAMREALTLDKENTLIATAAAKCLERYGDLLGAIHAYEELALADPNRRGDYAREKSKIQATLGLTDDAIASAREVISASPGSPEAYRFFADACFRLGRRDEGLDALRKAVRSDPSDTRMLMELADALVRAFRSDEAIELYQQVLRRSEDLQGKMGVIRKLADVHLERGTVVDLLANLERRGSTTDLKRETAYLTAQVHIAMGDVSTAMRTLEILHGDSEGDTFLLSQLVELARADSNTDQAILYQEELLELTDAPSDRTMLADLYMEADRTEEAEKLWDRMMDDQQDLVDQIASIDRLIGTERYELALSRVERLKRDNPSHWELLYREASVLVHLERNDEACRRLETLMAMDLPPDDPSESNKKTSGVSWNPGSQYGMSGYRQQNAFYKKMNVVELVMSEFQEESNGMMGMSTRQGAQQAWGPDTFSESQFAAIGILSVKEKKMPGATDLLAPYRDFDEPSDDPVLWEHRFESATLDFYLGMNFMMEEPNPELIGPPLMRMARACINTARTSNDVAWVGATLEIMEGFSQMQAEMGIGGSEDEIMTEEDVVFLADCFEQALEGGQQLMEGGGSSVLDLLKDRGLEDRAAQLEDVILAASKTSPNLLASLLMQAGQEGDLDRMIFLVNEAVKAAENAPAQPTPAYGGYQSSGRTWTYAMQNCLEMIQSQSDLTEEDEDKIMELAIRMLDFNFLRSGAEKLRNGQLLNSAGSYPGSMSRQNVWEVMGSTQMFGMDYDQQSQLDSLVPLFSVRASGDDDTIDLFVEHLQKHADEETGPDRQVALIAIQYLYAEHGREDDRLKVLETMYEEYLAMQEAESTSEDPAAILTTGTDPYAVQLSGTLALRKWGEDPEASIEMLDQIATTDPRDLIGREMLIIQRFSGYDPYGESVGEYGSISEEQATAIHERTEQAALQLFGMRLDSNQQMQLANAMRDLDMNEKADAILARAARTTSNEPHELIRIMDELSRNDNKEAAAQVANRLLRITAGLASRSSSGRQYDPSQLMNFREQAIRVLQESGNLDVMIERQEAQLAASPESSEVMKILIQYYLQVGRTEDAHLLCDRMIAALPEDPRAKMEAAQLMQNLGRNDAMVELYKDVVREDSSLLLDDYWEVTRGFRNSDQLAEFAEILEEINPEDVGNNYHQVVSCLSEVFDSDQDKDIEAAQKVFTKYWESETDSTPFFRQALLQQLSGPIMNDPEFFWPYLHERFATSLDKLAIAEDPEESASEGMSLAQARRLAMMGGYPGMGDPLSEWLGHGENLQGSMLGLIVRTAEGCDETDILWDEMEAYVETADAMEDPSEPSPEAPAIPARVIMARSGMSKKHMLYFLARTTQAAIHTANDDTALAAEAVLELLAHEEYVGAMHGRHTIFGPLLSSEDEHLDDAIVFYETVVNPPEPEEGEDPIPMGGAYSPYQVMYDYEDGSYRGGPAQTLVELYIRADRKDDARSLLLERVNAEAPSHYSRGPERTNWEIEQKAPIAQSLVMAGFIEDAIPMLYSMRDGIFDVERNRLRNDQYRYSSGSQSLQQTFGPLFAKMTYEQIMEQPSVLFLTELPLDEEAETETEADEPICAIEFGLFSKTHLEGGGFRAQNEEYYSDDWSFAGGVTPRLSGDQEKDIKTVNEAPDVEEPRNTLVSDARKFSVYSRLYETFLEAADSPEDVAHLRAILDPLIEVRPDDPTIIVASLLAERAWGDEASFQASLEHCRDWMKANPLSDEIDIDQLEDIRHGGLTLLPKIAARTSVWIALRDLLEEPGPHQELARETALLWMNDMQFQNNMYFSQVDVTHLAHQECSAWIDADADSSLREQRNRTELTSEWGPLAVHGDLDPPRVDFSEYHRMLYSVSESSSQGYFVNAADMLRTAFAWGWPQRSVNEHMKQDCMNSLFETSDQMKREVEQVIQEQASQSVPELPIPEPEENVDSEDVVTDEKLQKETGPLRSSWGPSATINLDEADPDAAAEAIYLAMTDIVLPPHRPTEVFLGRYDYVSNFKSQYRSFISPLWDWTLLAEREDELALLLEQRRAAIRSASDDSSLQDAESALDAIELNFALRAEDTARVEELSQRFLERLTTPDDAAAEEKKHRAAVYTMLALEPILTDPERRAPFTELIDAMLVGFEVRGVPNCLWTLILDEYNTASKSDDALRTIQLSEHYRSMYESNITGRTLPDRDRFGMDETLWNIGVMAIETQNVEIAARVASYFDDEPIDSFRRRDISSLLEGLTLLQDLEMPERRANLLLLCDIDQARSNNELYLAGLTTLEEDDPSAEEPTEEQIAAFEALGVPPKGEVVYQSRFAEEVGPEWSLPYRDITPQGLRPLLGEFGSNDSLEFSLDDLPAHQLVRIDMDVFFMSSSPMSHHTHQFRMMLGGSRQLVNTSFSSMNPTEERSPRQLYPDSFTNNQETRRFYPACTGASERSTLGYSQQLRGSDLTEWNAVYRLTQYAVHDGESLSLTLNSSGGYNNGDIFPRHSMSWGIINFKISAIESAAPLTDEQLDACIDALRGGDPMLARHARQRIIAAGDTLLPQLPARIDQMLAEEPPEERVAEEFDEGILYDTTPQRAVAGRRLLTALQVSDTTKMQEAATELEERIDAMVEESMKAYPEPSNQSSSHSGSTQRITVEGPCGLTIPSGQRLIIPTEGEHTVTVPDNDRSNAFGYSPSFGTGSWSSTPYAQPIPSYSTAPYYP